MIKLENVTKKFKENTIFENLNLTLDEGKIIQIKGDNGVGKSVFLKLIVGYSTPNKGIISIDNCQLGKDRDFINNAGVCINSPEFMDSYTGLDNLKYLASIKKIAKVDDILELARLLNLENDLDKKYKTYSLGMKQKLRLIQAMMDKPKYLILDEPFDSLDKKGQEIVAELSKKYIKEATDRTIIFVSHNLNDINDIADIVYIIDNKTISLENN